MSARIFLFWRRLEVAESAFIAAATLLKGGELSERECHESASVCGVVAGVEDIDLTIVLVNCGEDVEDAGGA